MADANFKKTIFDIFVDGAKKGWAIVTSSTIPNVVMAFIIIQILNVSGLLKIIGKVFGPVMGLFGLPGEAFTVLLSGWLSMGGGCGVAAKLFSDGTLNTTHLVILLPAIFLMGSQVQYLGRALGTANIQGRYYGIMIGLSILNAVISMFIMRLVAAFYI
ncbi:YjiG family protein [Deferribacterales bacterium RsTz2092]|nr:hypothetical protein AGMMS49941_11030 [Deferribacterales bacterium]